MEPDDTPGAATPGQAHKQLRDLAREMYEAAAAKLNEGLPWPPSLEWEDLGSGWHEAWGAAVQVALDALTPCPGCESLRRQCSELAGELGACKAGNAEYAERLRQAEADLAEVRGKLARALAANERWAVTLGDVQQRHSEVKAERNAAHAALARIHRLTVRGSHGDCLAIARDALAGDDQPSGPSRPPVVCLCGSTRFYDEFQDANYDLTMLGEIVLSVGFYPHAKAQHGHGEGVGHDSAEKVTLDELHKRKIDLADYVLVLNVGGYIGQSTRSEIEYARAHGKPVRYLEPQEGAA